ncbi:transcriptional regulator with XRE-family HTH domain [Rhizomicrobium palustre]|uniref:Transcriptional regulator with XRE-family HTH domain n=1 Tax=Rhizomicrobium palustre TaxID=189966 RepID=A0A846MW01_9PROT|nr:helix-turn-helix transcriptional regulator [Rhizomicrobium palustre]NIK87177.1 transcriptional regulator with XRE-family HTH domain [Rhizomicrobium palustre]
MIVGTRIRRLREAKGISRAVLARKIGVDVSSIAGWESGKRLPRDTVRTKLAKALDFDLAALMSPEEEVFAPARVAVLDVAEDFPAVLADCARRAKKMIRSARLGSPYSTTCNVQREARAVMGERLRKGEISVERAEIFYTLDRLKEVLHNILIYDGRPYYAKAYCIGLQEIGPFLGAWCFDEDEVFLGAYWRGFPVTGRPLLRLSGSSVKTFFNAYWKEIWESGTLLNSHGARDLTQIRDLAVKMGLNPRRWKSYVEEARALEIGDGAPPFL